MSAINALLRVVFDALMMPFGAIGPWWGLVLVSIISAVASLFLFKWLNNPEKVESAKRGMQAALFEIRLFNDDLWAILRATWNMIWYNLKYVLALLLIPMAFMLVPFTLAYFHLDPYFHHRGLEEGETALVQVKTEGEDRPDLRLEAPAGIVVETPGVWVPSESEMSWRIRAETAGEYDLKIHHAGGVETKTASVSDELVRRSATRPGTGFFAQLENPSEPPLPAASNLRSIELTYPDAEPSPYLWLIVWMVLIFVMAVAMKDLFGVTF